MKTFAKILMALGLMLVIVSVLLNTINEPGSPESIVSWINVGLGALMLTISAVYLAVKTQKQAEKQKGKDTEKE